MVAGLLRHITEGEDGRSTMSFLYRKRLGRGYTAIVEAGDPHLRYIEFGVLRLEDPLHLPGGAAP